MNVIERVPSNEQIRRAYDLWSRFYQRVAAPLEHGARMRALDAARIRPAERVLEVAVGTGAMLVEILKRVDCNTPVHGTDLSWQMLLTARRRAAAAGFGDVCLEQADARWLPFPDGAFDVLYNSYMLDLMATEEISAALREFGRVLRPGGRLVLVNMSKRQADSRTWYETLYRAMPRSWAAYLLGGCRPVCLVDMIKWHGYRDIRRDYVPQLLASEIVTAVRP